jgi:hypothetical protein
MRSVALAATMVALLLLTGCFPAVMHGPRVQPGLVGSVTASVAAGPTYTEGDEGGMRARNAPVGAGIGYGWRGATAARPSVFAGVHVPIVFPLAQLDVYVQAPESWLSRGTGGVGVNTSIEHAAPYLQWGVVDADGRGWSTIQGLSVRFTGGEGRTIFAWTPGVVAHVGSGHGRAHLYAMAAVGRHRSCSQVPFQSVECGVHGTYALLAGATLELRRSADPASSTMRIVAPH